MKRNFFSLGTVLFFLLIVFLTSSCTNKSREICENPTTKKLAKRLLKPRITGSFFGIPMSAFDFAKKIDVEVLDYKHEKNGQTLCTYKILFYGDNQTKPGLKYLVEVYAEQKVYKNGETYIQVTWKDYSKL